MTSSLNAGRREAEKCHFNICWLIQVIKVMLNLDKVGLLVNTLLQSDSLKEDAGISAKEPKISPLVGF